MNRASSRGRGDGDEGGSHRIKVLEGGIKKAKESERKMLESLVSQTKQLEQAKMELEEARLEIRNLQRSIGGRPESSRAPRASGNFFRSLLEQPPPPSAPARSEGEEVARLRAELRLAVEAEEKSRTAMDGLALALKEVTEEANRAKDQLAAATAEADRLKAVLGAKEDNLRVVLAEVDRLRLEAEECEAAWGAKEEGLIGCVKASDEEAAKMAEENRRLLDSMEEAREENARLRDIMKQALNEADVAKAALEIARRENSQLQSQISEKDTSLDTVTRDSDCPKAAGGAAVAAVQSVRQHRCLPASWRSRSARSLGGGSGSSAKPDDMFRSERWGNGAGAAGPPIQKGEKASEHESGWSAVAPSRGEKGSGDGRVGCVSNMGLDSLVTGLGNCGAASFGGHGRKVGSDGRSRWSGSSSDKQKRKQILRKFDELLRRKSLHSHEKAATAGPLAL